MTYQTEQRILFTVVVDLLDYTRAKELHNFSVQNNARACVGLMCRHVEEPPLSELREKVEQIHFYYDELNSRGIFTGTVPEARLEKDEKGNMDGRQFAGMILTETGLSADSKDYSWILIALGSLAAGNGDLVIENASGQVGGQSMGD